MENNYKQIYQKNNSECDECVAKGICSTAPALSYLHETIIAYLQDLAFYLIRLKKLGITNETIKENITNILSSIVINTIYDENSYHKIITKIYEDLMQAKELYSSICKKNHIIEDYLKINLKNPLKLSYTASIKLGQNIFNQKLQKYSEEEKNLNELIMNIIKSICIHMIELKQLGVNNEESYEMILYLLDIKNSSKITKEELYEIINKIVVLDHKLLVTLQETKEQQYGVISPTEISTSTRSNKAILVSGTNLKELELLLEATKDKGIDIYTHGHMLMAHAYSKFKTHPHLVGHWGKGIENYLFDFAEFPGVIFLTKHSFFKTENLYRSRIYTTDVIAPKGVILIRSNDFEPLIQSAINAKGFSKAVEKPFVKITLDEKAIHEKIIEIAQKIKEGKIKHLIGIGISNQTKKQKDYFERFLKLIGDDCFVVSLSYYEEKDNIFFVESDYGFSFFYKALDILKTQIDIDYSKMVALYTRCEIHSISNILYVKHLGVNKIYFPECPPTLINPSIINAMKKTYNIKDYTTPEADLKEMLAD